MNNVTLIGRLTKDPDVRYNNDSMAVGRFTIAINRGKGKNGEDKGTDYPNIVCFGKTAELVDRYVAKGRMVGIQGHIQTGSYEKDGKKVYTTEVVADRVEFLDMAKKEEEPVPTGFNKLNDDDILF